MLNVAKWQSGVVAQSGRLHILRDFLHFVNRFLQVTDGLNLVVGEKSHTFAPSMRIIRGSAHKPRKSEFKDMEDRFSRVRN